MAGDVARIEAAGGVLWRMTDSRRGVEVVLVHRPNKEGWSLPKGKLHAGEHPVIAALREVREETGFRASLGPALGTTSYLKGGQPKRVRYWSMSAVDGRFTPSAEIDDLTWVSLRDAARLTRRRDLPVIARFRRVNAFQTRPLLLVPPVGVSSEDGSAKNHRRSLGGREQAKALGELIQAFGVQRALVAEALRCTETLRPFEQVIDVKHESVLVVRDTGPRARVAVDQLLEVAQEGVPAVVCAEASLLARLTDELGAGKTDLRRRISRLQNGSLLVLHFDRGPGRLGGQISTTEWIRTGA
ncbi:NUDIX hydrolase [Nocardioides iriomotensis]|uniref:NUDIX hydrolase n=1 Tax=Nocardioides iriomotensis TaxID=715784 RepID=A0A4Q5J903_9ACTN|nr:NUDIX hydrolase [Nocardioides iriomotensis]RYU15114.1 NUDIX hydrolase [Nocardioides iriomotensis]